MLELVKHHTKTLSCSYFAQMDFYEYQATQTNAVDAPVSEGVSPFSAFTEPDIQPYLAAKSGLPC